MRYTPARSGNSPERYGCEIRFWGILLFAATLMMDMACYFIHGHSVVIDLFGRTPNLGVKLLHKSTPLAIAFLFFALAGWSRFSRREGILLGAAGLFLAAWLLWLDTPDVFTVFGTIYLLLFPAAYYWVVREFFSKLSVRAENGGKDFVQLRIFLWISLIPFSILVATTSMLHLNIVLLTLTYDLYLYKIDAAFLGAAQWIAQIGKDYAGPQKLTLFVYTMLGSLLFPLLALLVRDGKIRELHSWRTFLVPYLAASLSYAWLPASGPTYAIEGYPFGI